MNRITPAPGVAAAVAKARAESHGLSPERAEKRAKEAEDLAYIGQIATRAVAYVASQADMNPTDWNRTNIVIMMIQVKKTNPHMNLKQFAEFDDFNFLHDFFGIAKHAQHPTGKLDGHFLPRCARSRDY